MVKKDQQDSGDRISVRGVGPGAAVAAGRGASASVGQTSPQLSALVKELAEWRKLMDSKIDASADLLDEEKLDLREQVAKIEAEAAKGEQAQPSRLEKLVNTLAVMSHDIFEVTIATLTNPLAGIGLVLKKVGDKAAKVEKGSNSKDDSASQAQ